MNSECSLVLGLLSDGRINVDEAERLIRRLTSAMPVRQPKSESRSYGVPLPSYVPPHFPSGFDAQATTVAV